MNLFKQTMVENFKVGITSAHYLQIYLIPILYYDEKCRSKYFRVDLMLINNENDLKILLKNYTTVS